MPPLKARKALWQELKKREWYRQIRHSDAGQIKLPAIKEVPKNSLMALARKKIKFSVEFPKAIDSKAEKRLKRETQRIGIMRALRRRDSPAALNAKARRFNRIVENSNMIEIGKLRQARISKAFTENLAIVATLEGISTGELRHFLVSTQFKSLLAKSIETALSPDFQRDEFLQRTPKQFYAALNRFVAQRRQKNRF